MNKTKRYDIKIYDYIYDNRIYWIKKLKYKKLFVDLNCIMCYINLNVKK